MRSYIARRLLMAIPTILIIGTLVFFMGHYAPADPVTAMLGDKGNPEDVARLKKELGLDLPVGQQYVNFLKNALQGSFGTSLVYRGQTVGAIIARGLPRSAGIAALAILLTTIVGIPMGVIAALYRDTWLDRLAMFMVLIGISVPHFVLAFVAMYVVGFQLKWLPIAGWGTPAHAVLPIIILGIRPAAFITRLTRSSMLEVLLQDYVRTARAKGLAERKILAKHALRNAVIPVVTALGTTFGRLITGSFFIESIFAVPGIGRMSVNAIYMRDYPAIQAITVLIATVFVLMNLVVDICYSAIDPRIRYH